VVGLERADVRYDPFRILGPAPPPATVVRRAAARARGALFLVLVPGRPLEAQALAAVPRGFRRVESVRYPGMTPIEVVVVRQTASGA
jgi:hypothetical protein